MIRRMLAAAVAVALGAGPAAGQDAAAFIDRVEVRSAQISPGGGEVAFIRRTDGKQLALSQEAAAFLKQGLT